MSKINEARVLANKGQYKAVSSGGVVRIMYKGKEIASGDFDSGADGWFVMGKNDKGQKFFGDAQDMVDYFVRIRLQKMHQLTQQAQQLQEQEMIHLQSL